MCGRSREQSPSWDCRGQLEVSFNWSPGNWSATSPAGLRDVYFSVWSNTSTKSWAIQKQSHKTCCCQPGLAQGRVQAGTAGLSSLSECDTPIHFSVPQRVAVAVLAVFTPGCSLCLVVHLQRCPAELCSYWTVGRRRMLQLVQITLQEQWLDAPVTLLRSWFGIVLG